MAMAKKKKNKRSSSSSSSNAIESKRKKMRKTKKKKKIRRAVRGRINSLPDSILHHVLSFLSMKQAIRTSLVSKRWRYLWTCTPTLNFTNTKNKLMEFVDAVLILRDNNCNIQRLSITGDNDNDYDYYDDVDSSFPFVDDDDDADHYYSDSDSDNSDNSVYFSDSDSDYNYTYNYNSVKNPNLRLNRWIRNAIIRNVEEIHLEFHFNKRVKLPHCLFTCNSLRKLKLISLDSLPHELVLPGSISLPRLEILHLDGLSLHHEGDDKINTFLSECCYSSLRYLTLKECRIHRKNLNIVAPNLKRLVIDEFIDKDDNSRNNKYVKHRQVTTGSIRICAPNLISFYCKDYLLKSYCLENTSSTLFDAYIDMKVSEKAEKVAGVQEKGRNAMIHQEKKKIDFRILHNVKHLRLNAWALQVFIATYGLLDSGFTEFQDLRSLKLETWLSGECIRGITWLLNISPNIVNLSLKIIQDTITPVLPHWDEIQLNPSDIGDYWELPLQSEEHTIYDHLSTVEIRGLKGRVNELKFLEVLLKNAVVLEKLILVFCLDSGDRNRDRQLIDYSEILHSFPKASSTVKIFFISSS